MAQLKSNPITQSDIEEYLAGQADFSFELRVLKELVDLGLICSHSGTYDDPITGKSREFDIRALLLDQEKYLRVHLSVECKNIRENFPMIVHCLKRKENESYNELVATYKPEEKTEEYGLMRVALPSVFQEYSKSVRVTNLR